jgi:hypothetical protein
VLFYAKIAQNQPRRFASGQNRQNKNRRAPVIGDTPLFYCNKLFDLLRNCYKKYKKVFTNQEAYGIM